jgi:hypothetical protein
MQLLLKVPDCDLDWEQARANAFGVVTGLEDFDEGEDRSSLRSRGLRIVVRSSSSASPARHF